MDSVESKSKKKTDLTYSVIWHTITNSVEAFKENYVQTLEAHKVLSDLRIEILLLEKKGVSEEDIDFCAHKTKFLGLEKEYERLVVELEKERAQIRRSVESLDATKCLVFLYTKDVLALKYIQENVPEQLLFFRLGLSAKTSEADRMRQVSGLENLTSATIHRHQGGSIRKLTKAEAEHMGFYTSNYNEVGKREGKSKLVDDVLFADAAINIYRDCIGDLELAANKFLSSSEFELDNYGDTFFQVVFIGGLKQPGKVKPDERHPYSVIECEPRREDILPSVSFVKSVLCMKPFLHENLRRITGDMLDLLEYFDKKERKCVAVFTALTFTEKLASLLPETVFEPLFKSNLVDEGISLSFITDFFKAYLVDGTMDGLVLMLDRGNINLELLEFFPPAERTPRAFSEHFTEAGLPALVDFNKRRTVEIKTDALRSVVQAQAAAERVNHSVIIESFKQIVEHRLLSEEENLSILWDALMTGVEKNPESVLDHVKKWVEVLGRICAVDGYALIFLHVLQDWCSDDGVASCFPKMIRLLLEHDVLWSDIVLIWYRDGGRPTDRYRESFLNLMGPLVGYLKEKEKEKKKKKKKEQKKKKKEQEKKKKEQEQEQEKEKQKKEQEKEQEKKKEEKEKQKKEQEKKRKKRKKKKKEGEESPN